MLVTLSGIVTFVSLLQLENALCGMAIVQPNSMLHPLPIGPAVFRLLQSEKAAEPMLVTLSGIVTLVRLLQPQKATFPMLVTPSGIVTLVRLPQ